METKFAKFLGIDFPIFAFFGHREPAQKILDEHDIPPLHDGNNNPPDRLMMTDTTRRPQIDVALAHKNVKLIANALGTPPADIIKQVQDAGVLIGPRVCGVVLSG